MAGEARRARLRALLTTAGAGGADVAPFEAAFVHESAVREGLAPSSNERLEFLGDAVLGAIVARSLFERYPDAPEGELALRKSALVADAALARSAARLGFDALVTMGAGLSKAPPERRSRVLADAFEAFVAALDAHAGARVARRFVDREHIAHCERAGPLEDDPKTVLQEWSQRRFRTTPRYVDRALGPDHARTFDAVVTVADVSATGEGLSKKAAQRAAALAALALVRERYDDVEPRAFSRAQRPAR